MTKDKKRFIRRAALLAALVLALNGCRADTGDQTDGTGETTEETTVTEVETTAQTEPVVPPEWTYASNQYITDEGVRFRLVGDHMFFEYDATGEQKWDTYAIAIEDMRDGYWLNSLTCMFFGQLDEEGKKLWLAFGEPYEAPNYASGRTHFLYFSEDGGQTWLPTNVPALQDNGIITFLNLTVADVNANGVACMVMDRYNSVFSYVEVYCSWDFGNTWTRISVEHQLYGYSERITDCRVLDDGTIQIDLQKSICYDPAEGMVTDIFIYEKKPTAEKFTLVNEIPPGTTPTWPEAK